MSEKNAALVGKILGGCKIRRLIGRGGMGAVYEALHIGLEKKVAVKVLPASLAGRRESLKRFLREAKAAARLEHPHIVQVMNVGRKGDDHYIVMQLVEGESLGDRMAREERLPVHEACRFVAQAASALDAAHDKGFVHRDIKPDNLLITPDDDVKVTDFGLAGRADRRSSISTPDQILGTPFFMSPEQCRGEQAGPASDVYALGATFYYLVTGVFPFEGDTAMATLLKHINEPLVPPRHLADEIPRELSDLIEAMMEKDPASRPQTMKEVRERVARIGGVPVEAGAAPSPAGKPSRILPGALAGAVVLAIGTAALILVLSTGGRDGDPRPEETPGGDPRGEETAVMASAEAFYRKGAFDAASGTLETFAAGLDDDRQPGRAFKALLEASERMDRAGRLKREGRYEEAVRVLEGFPPALAAEDVYADVREATRRAQAEAEVARRARAFVEILQKGETERIADFLSRRRETREMELLTTAARVIFKGIRIESMEIVSVQRTGKTVVVRIRGSGTRRGTGDAWAVEETTEWRREKGRWILGGPRRSTRFIEMAVRLRTEQLIDAINRRDRKTVESFFLSRGKLRFHTFKGVSDILRGALVKTVESVDLHTFKIDWDHGTVYTEGRQTLRARFGGKQEESDIKALWIPDEGTFKFLYLPGEKGKPR